MRTLGPRFNPPPSAGETRANPSKPKPKRNPLSQKETHVTPKRNPRHPKMEPTQPDRNPLNQKEIHSTIKTTKTIQPERNPINRKDNQTHSAEKAQAIPLNRNDTSNLTQPEKLIQSPLNQRDSTSNIKSKEFNQWL